MVKIAMSEIKGRIKELVHSYLDMYPDANVTELIDLYEMLYRLPSSGECKGRTKRIIHDELLSEIKERNKRNWTVYLSPKP